MSKHTLEVPFDIGMLLTMNKQLVVIISNEPKDERLVDIINKNDEFYAFFVKDMDAYKVLADGLEKAKRTFFPVLIPHTPKSHQRTIMEFLKNAPINIPLHVSDAGTVEDLFDTSLLEEMRRGYGGDYLNLLDFDRPESRSAAKSLLPRLKDVPESARFGVSSEEHAVGSEGVHRNIWSERQVVGHGVMTIDGKQYAVNPTIGGDVYDRLGLTRRRNLDGELYKFGDGMRMITSDIHLADFRGHRNLTTACKAGLSYTALGGDWSYPQHKKSKPPAAAKVRGLNNNGMPSKRGKGRS